jgi:hypothetical protein
MNKVNNFIDWELNSLFVIHLSIKFTFCLRNGTFLFSIALNLELLLSIWIFFSLLLSFPLSFSFILVHSRSFSFILVHSHHWFILRYIKKNLMHNIHQSYFQILKRFDFGDFPIDWIRLIATSPGYILSSIPNSQWIESYLSADRKPICCISQINWSGVLNQQIARTKSVPNICQIGIQGHRNQRSISSRRANQFIWANDPLQCDCPSC